MASIVAVCLSKDRSLRKDCVPQVLLRKDYGIVGDAHAGSIRQVSLLARESVERACSQGRHLGYGDSAENLLTQGVDLVSLPLGTQLHIGRDVILEITRIGKENDSHVFRLLVTEGVFARVVRGGKIMPGDVLRVEEYSGSSSA